MDGGGGLGGLRWTAEEASTIGGIATVSLLHSFIPTHWLPFSIVARAQRWPLSRTLLVSESPSFLPPPLSPHAPRVPPLAAIAARAAAHRPPDLGPNLMMGGWKRALR